MTKPIIFGFYGKSNSGKTNLLLDIIKYFKDKNYKIGSIKITDKEIQIDAPGKDSWKYAEAGSDLVVLSSLNETDFILKQGENIKEIIKKITKIGSFDLILIEGANDEDTLKIRIGDIDKRKNTILTYNNNFEELVNVLEIRIKEK